MAIQLQTLVLVGPSDSDDGTVLVGRKRTLASSTSLAHVPIWLGGTKIMLAPTRHSPEFAVAREVLQLADKGLRSQYVYSPAHVTSQGLSQPVCFAATRWLSAVIEGVEVPVETSILSEGELPGGTAQNNIFSLVVIHGRSVYCQLSGNHKGAGGRPSSQQQQDSVITKKGPDAWTVSAQVWEHQRTSKLLSSVNCFTVAICSCK